MTESTRSKAGRSAPTSAEPSCLYPDEREIAACVLGKDRAKFWPGLAVVLERDGMPRKDPEFQARYWPAVKAFLDDRNHLDEHGRFRRTSR